MLSPFHDAKLRSENLRILFYAYWRPIKPILKTQFNGCHQFITLWKFIWCFAVNLSGYSFVKKKEEEVQLYIDSTHHHLLVLPSAYIVYGKIMFSHVCLFTCDRSYWTHHPLPPALAPAPAPAPGPSPLPHGLSYQIYSNLYPPNLFKLVHSGTPCTRTCWWQVGSWPFTEKFSSNKYRQNIDGSRWISGVECQSDPL